MIGIRRRSVVVLAIGAIVAMAGACVPQPPLNSGDGQADNPAPQLPSDESSIRLNQIQMIGSHNSYHVAPEAPILDWLGFFAAAVPEAGAALGDPNDLNYTHAPLPTQLARGLRSFELDVFADPDGGRFAHPLLPDILNLSVARPTGVDQPGLKVLHIQDIDFISTCPTFTGCLSQMKTWSDSHRDHLPILINVELKDDPLPAPFDATSIVPFDGPQLDEVDSEIRSVLGDRLITPDDVRGDAADLRTAVTTTGWPTLAESRGRFLFFIDNANKRDLYLEGHPSLAGRAMFTSSGEGQPDGAVLKENDPGDGSRIRSLVEQGYLVRTRADDQVTRPSVTQRDIALASGAQIVSTDFPAGESALGSGYVVSFGTNPQARCNPVNIAIGVCAPAALRELAGAGR